MLVGGKGHVAMKGALSEEIKKARGGGGRTIVLAMEGGRERAGRWEGEINGG